MYLMIYIMHFLFFTISERNCQINKVYSVTSNFISHFAPKSICLAIFFPFFLTPLALE